MTLTFKWCLLDFSTVKLLFFPLPYFIHKRPITKPSLHSRGRELHSISWTEGHQRISWPVPRARGAEGPGAVRGPHPLLCTPLGGSRGKGRAEVPVRPQGGGSHASLWVQQAQDREDSAGQWCRGGQVTAGLGAWMTIGRPQKTGAGVSPLLWRGWSRGSGHRPSGPRVTGPRASKSGAQREAC